MVAITALGLGGERLRDGGESGDPGQTKVDRQAGRK